MKRFNFTQLIKHTLWSEQLFTITAETKEDAIRKAKSMVNDDVTNRYDEVDLGTYEDKFDTDVNLDPKENNGFSTKEIYFQDGKDYLIASNGNLEADQVMTYQDIENYKRTEKAEDILAGIEKIKKWLSDHLRKKSVEVFMLGCEYEDETGKEMNMFLYLAQENNIICIRGEEKYIRDNFNTGMSTMSFYHLIQNKDGNIIVDYTKLNPDGNLVRENGLVSIMKNWNYIKYKALEAIKPMFSIDRFEA